MTVSLPLDVAQSTPSRTTSLSITTRNSWADLLALPVNERPPAMYLTPERKAELFRQWELSALEWQATCHQDQHRFQVIDLGRRAGKTKYGGREVAMQAA